MISNGKTTNYLNGGAVPANTWTHVAVVFAPAASNSVLYVNGLPVATNSAITLFPDSLNAPLMANANYLGRGNAGNYFQGSVDDFRVYHAVVGGERRAGALQHAGAGGGRRRWRTRPRPRPAWLVSPYAVSDSAITMSATWADQRPGLERVLLQQHLRRGP